MGKTIRLKNDIRLDSNNLSLKNKITCAYAGGSMTWDTAWTWVKVPLYGLDYNGVGFGVSSSNFYVPAKVSLIKVSICFSYYNNDINGGDKNISLYKNGNQLAMLAYTNYNENNYYTSVSGVAVVSVSQNDEIAIYINSSKAGTMRLFNCSRIVIENLT